MNKHTRIAALLTFSALASLDAHTALARPLTPEAYGAAWWTWALSIPTSKNPILDLTGEDCGVRQSGSVWFLAGTFGADAVSRTCTISRKKTIVFPVVNSMNVDTPNVCGQGSESFSIEQLRAFSAGFIDGITSMSVELDGSALEIPERTKSPVFTFTLPRDNLFNAPCADFGDVPPGAYRAAVDDGYYVSLTDLSIGQHVLRFRAEGPGGFNVDVTYLLTITR